MRLQIGRAFGPVRVDGVVYESPNGVHIDNGRVTDAKTGQSVQGHPDPDNETFDPFGGERW